MSTLSLGNGSVENVSVGLLMTAIKKLDGDKVGQMDADGVFYMADEGVPMPIQGQLEIQGVPRAYISREISLDVGSKYRITGTVQPVGSTLNISNTPVKVFDSLAATIIYSAVSDDDGKWAIDVDEWGGDAIIWCETAPSAIGITSARFTYEADKILEDDTVADVTTGGTSTSNGGPCPQCDGAGDVLSICGSCIGTGKEFYDYCDVCGGSGRKQEGTIWAEIINDSLTCSNGALFVESYIVFTPTALLEPWHCYDVTYKNENFEGSDSMTAMPALSNDPYLSQICDTQMTFIGDYHMVNPSTNTHGGGFFLATGKKTDGESIAVFSINSTAVTQFTCVDVSCEACGGSGRYFDDEQCPYCDGKGETMAACEYCGGGGTYNPCLTGDTMITLADGSERRFDELTEDDELMDKDGEATGIISIASGHWRPDYIKYIFEDGTIIKEVHAHRFYNVEQGFWQKLAKWEIGEHAIDISGNHIALVSKEVVDEPKEMFGVWTESGNYFADGLLSGDASANVRLLPTASLEKALDMMSTLDEYQLWNLTGLESVFP